MRTRHLKKRIALSLMLFIGLGMILIDLVLSLMTYRQGVKSEISQARATLAAIAYRVESSSTVNGDFALYLSDLAAITELGIVVIGRQDEVFFQSKMDKPLVEKLLEFTTLHQLAPKIEKKFYGGYFGLLGQQYDHLFLVKSLQTAKGASFGAVGVDIPLWTFSQSTWQGQRFVWLYIFFNLVILSGLAYWRFSHFLIIPLQQIAEKAASYQDDDLYLTSDFQTDDVSKLSRSLDQMFKRIHADREELQKMVLALEEVNDSLTKAQSDIIRAEKLASVGRLSAGIAHEIGNPLGIVLGYLDLLKGVDITDSERLDFTSRAMAEIQRINTIIRQLLDLARPEDNDGGCGSCSVHAVLQSFQHDRGLKAVMGELILEFDLTAERDTVEINREKLHQVFLNLILNGADAVQGGEVVGKMKITTAVIEDGNERSKLEIRFIDNGPGIDPAHIKQVFDPFFTTKEVGDGTGLGLSVSYMIIENGGGTIQALSDNKRRGTEFRITLPLVNGDGSMKHRGIDNGQ